MNSTVARTDTGEIKDQSATQAVTTPTEGEVKPTEPVAGPPEKYEFKAPEGATVDAKVVETVTPLLKELGLTQEQAQKLYDFHAAATADQTKTIGEALTKQVSDMRESWRAEVKADKDIGANLPKVLENIGKLKALMPENIRTAFNADMDFTGVGDRLGFLKAFNFLAGKLTEGNHVTGGGPSKHGQSATGQAAKPSMAAAMYPNLVQ